MQPAAPWPQAIHPPSDVSCFEFRPGGFSEASHALEHDDGMLRLEISVGSEMDVADWQRFTDALRTNTVLVSLRLADTRLPEAGLSTQTGFTDGEAAHDVMLHDAVVI
jgi:hypothetical protein